MATAGHRDYAGASVRRTLGGLTGSLDVDS